MCLRSLVASLILALTLVGVTACQTPASPLEELANAVPTKPAPTPAAAVAAATVSEATPRATPFPFLRLATSTPATSLATSVATSSATATRTPSGPTATPTPTPEPTPQPQFVKAVGDLAGKVDDLLAAVRDRDNPRALVIQRELLEQLDRVEKAAKADRSKLATEVTRIGRDLRAGATADPAKLAVVRAELYQLLGRAAAGTAVSIIDLQAFANQLVGKVAEFRKALDQNDTTRLLTLQGELLAQVDRASAELKDSPSRQAERLRSALDDLRNGLSGDANRLKSAEAKLLEVAGSTRTSITRPLPIATPSPVSVDVRPLANDLSNRFEQYTLAAQGNNPTALAKARADLLDAMSAAETRLQGNTSSGADQLRAALTLVREVLAGDTAKQSFAVQALKQAISP